MERQDKVIDNTVKNDGWMPPRFDGIQHATQELLRIFQSTKGTCHVTRFMFSGLLIADGAMKLIQSCKKNYNAELQ